jgi:hypothetical protein
LPFKLKLSLIYKDLKKQKERNMPKKVFWPASLVVMGLVFMASNMGYLPVKFFNLWPIILVVVGLGGLVTSDRDEWMCCSKPKKSARRKKRKK